NPDPPARRLRTRTDLHGDRAAIRLTGEVDLGTAPGLRRAICACLGQHHPCSLALELAEVSFCDCTGLNTLLWARLEAADAGAALVVRGPLQHGVARLLSVTGTDAVLGPLIAA
ncbi:STAS domain-containing protein, partial [Streptomyces huiliensis]|uniref:STAS domain-containing protein n=1 Tax=Streptomyces huiliensis TaxID=2876027 RepID=UPI001CBCD475